MAVGFGRPFSAGVCFLLDSLRRSSDGSIFGEFRPFAAGRF